MRTLAAQRWHTLSITTKFSVAFGLLLALMLFIALSSYLALTTVHREMEAAIVNSTEIQKLVLEMDRGLENARRLQSNFFLQYPTIGFAKAHSLYVTPAIEQIATVIDYSATLKARIAGSDVSAALRERDVDLNLYLSSAERNAQIFLEAVEMAEKLAAPTTGLLDQLAHHSAELYAILRQAAAPDLELLYREMQAFEKDYLLTRRRPFLQSALNEGERLQRALEAASTLEATQRTAARTHLQDYLNIAEQIATLDVEIRSKFQDFDLQAASLDPISTELLILADAEVARARNRINQINRLAIGIMGSIAVLSLAVALFIGELLNRSITRNVIALTHTAAALQRGDLGAVARVTSADELGQLAAAFNAMAAEIQAKVTELTTLNLALQASEKKYRKLFEDSYDVIAVTTLSGELLDTNPAAEKLLGWPRAALIGRNVNALYVNPQDRPAFIAAVQQTGALSSETELRRADGETIHVLLNTTVQRDEDGQITGLLTIVHDITERIHAEQVQREADAERARLLAEIREQARRIQQIVDTVPEGVILLDRDYRVMLANPTAQRYLETLTDAAVNAPLARLGNRPIRELLTSPPKGLWHEVNVDGPSARIFQVLARSVENGSQPSNWVMVIHEITQQRQIERQIEQQERLAAVGQLAAGIAHDFNNIMATIVLYAQMMARVSGLAPRERERLQIINQQALHASNLIQQILDFSRRAALERRPLDLAPLLKEHVKLLMRTLPENIHVELHLGTDDYTIEGDPTRIQQMLMNLAVNARDAMPQGGHLSFHLERVHFADSKTLPLPGISPGDWIMMTVTDTGSGIPAHVLPHIFEPFFTTKPPGQGSGLGLAQVHGIVGAHEGYIDVQTQTGALPAATGTTFIIYLPAFSAAAPQPHIQESAELPHGHGETILLVEDNPTTRNALVESLQLLNYRVLVAEDGQQALTLFQQRTPNDIALILSDVVMPNMGGIALFHALREQEARIKMILVSGHPLTNELETLQAEDAVAERSLLVGWMLKPPTLEQLANIVARGIRA